MSETHEGSAPGGVRVSGVVVAAGSSRRLGQPKQLLEFRGRTLLDASLDAARAAIFDQRVVTVGAHADAIDKTVNTDGFEVVLSENAGDGCSSSIVGALRVVSPESDGLVMLLGDQPDIDPAAVGAVIAAGASAPIAVCRYEGDTNGGIGHPFWFARSVFDDLASLRGDKAVWKLIESGRHEVVEVPIAGDIPLDVDTREDYERLLATDASRGNGTLHA